MASRQGFHNERVGPDRANENPSPDSANEKEDYFLLGHKIQNQANYKYSNAPPSIFPPHKNKMSERILNLI